MKKSLNFIFILLIIYSAQAMSLDKCNHPCSGKCAASEFNHQCDWKGKTCTCVSGAFCDVVFSGQCWEL